jgi:hypothetical protein
VLLALSPDVIDQQNCRQNFVRNVKQRVKHKERTLTSVPPQNSELHELCRILHQLAQKYVPNTPQAFCDFDALTRVTKALMRLNAAAPVAAHIAAPAKSVESAVVTNSVEYRVLRNKFIAALATIADLTAKNTPPGAPDYQRGVREGYRRASDVAILFLEDIQTGVL